jgi:hypothetical protein
MKETTIWFSMVRIIAWNLYPPLVSDPTHAVDVG